MFWVSDSVCLMVAKANVPITDYEMNTQAMYVSTPLVSRFAHNRRKSLS